MSPAVSVLIPAYNRAEVIAETLDSILSQTLPPAEVIVVDDGSTDKTGEVVKRFGSRVLYRHIENGRVCRARNVAISMAGSPYLALCDSDDLWRKDKLALQMELHTRDPELQVSFTNFAIVSKGEWSQETKFDTAPTDFFAPYGSTVGPAFVYPVPLYDRILQFQPIFPSTFLFTRALVNRVGEFVESLGRNPSEDLEFILRCVQHHATGVVTEPVVGIRKHEGNFSGDLHKVTLAQLEILAYAQEHHAIGEGTHAVIQDQIYRRRVEAAYGPFREGRFDEMKALLAGVPAGYLDSKTRLKLRIAKLPGPLARGLQKLLLKEETTAGQG